MTTQKQLDIVKLLQEGTKATRKIVASVKPEQLKQSTPCKDWDVQALLNHMIQGPDFMTGMVTGTKPDRSKAAKNNLEAYDRAVEDLIKALKAKGALEKKIQGPMGEMTGFQVGSMAFADNLLHGWDLAKATGQNTKIDPKLAEACYNIVAPTAEMARKRGAFGPEVKVPPSATFQDRLLGITGRQP